MHVKKGVTRNEYLTSVIASRAGIGPKIFGYQTPFMKMEKLEMTLEEYREEFGLDKEMKEKIVDKVRRLHQLGIFHGDLHDENIMISNEEPFLIDFGESVRIQDIDSDYIKYYNNRWDELEEVPAENLQDLLNHEMFAAWQE